MISVPHRSELTPDEKYCEALTRREAKNFYWGFIALPRQKRMAIYALYSFARQVDDEIDLAGRESGSRDGLIDRFGSHRVRLDDCFSGVPRDPVMRMLSEITSRYDIPRGELEALIDGVEMDINLTRYESWDQLRTYCLHVASSVGRMCVRIFGFSDPEALTCADDLGVAMQLANILRDVREDRDIGRIYLPREDLRSFHVNEPELLDGAPGSGWEPLMRHEIERVRALFHSGLGVSNFIPRRSAACVFTMAGIYQGIVEEIARDPYLPLKQRASLGGREKISVMFKSWLRAV